jgi:hypothetical protein
MKSVQGGQETPALFFRMLAWYGAMLIGFCVIQFTLLAVMNIETSTGALAATVLAAMVPGDVYSRRTHQTPSKGFGWGVAIGFALVGLCVSVIQVNWSARLGSSQAIRLSGDAQFLFLMLFLHLIMIGPLKWAFGWGASIRQRANAEKAARTPPTKL